MSQPAQQHLDHVRTYLASAFEIPEGELTGDRTFESLELDSIAQVEMFVTLSDHYGIHLDDSLANGEMTLRQTAELITEALEGVGRQRQDSGSPVPQG
ncbi:acyl carrier protein [Streptomyces melanogenes]|uniref:acyl carrier protein n=1 Tax=Streptomyces melanogenes TaxID=67326 RepID=UPI0037A686C5